jgi:non-heme chloroperoxidase
MFKESHPNYFYNKNKERIFYTTNFPAEDIPKDKPLLVFNYGLVCSNAHWEKQLPFFDKLGFPILIHDYRGHYSSSSYKNLKDISFKSYADDIKQLIDQLGGEEIIMFGHSMGVNVTLEFARLYPENLKGIIVISGTVLPPQDVMFDSNIVSVVMPFVEWLFKNYPGVSQKLWSSSFLNPLALRAIHRGGFNHKYVPIEFIQVYLKRVGLLPPEVFLHLMRQMRDHDIVNDLEKLCVPTLIIGGDKDKVIPNYLQQILHKYIPNSELYILKDGSHVPQHDYPQNINKRSSKFIQNRIDS